MFPFFTLVVVNLVVICQSNW